MYGDSDYIITILIFFQVIMIPITIQAMRTMPIYILCIRLLALQLFSCTSKTFLRKMAVVTLSPALTWIPLRITVRRWNNHYTTYTCSSLILNCRQDVWRLPNSQRYWRVCYVNCCFHHLCCGWNQDKELKTREVIVLSNCGCITIMQ